ncbi:MAG TPA: 2-C-methyl-D-erythritol 4-phosphate cytidylyltransferase [Thiobacillaceae bacterium]|nr:2-C-methyl-D-erythritol 4-phosphate cytidylyltransferase [Thiobacillaceae bacterium]
MKNKHYALIPAAGSGNRMGGGLPKQYLSVAGRPMIYHAIHTMFTHPRIARVYVVLSAADSHWETFDWGEFDGKLVVLRCGGDTRALSVSQGLQMMAGAVGAKDWVLVHDAARPGLDHMLLDRLLDALAHDPVGGLLAVPVADTLKRSDANQRVIATECRAGLWQAQTPQMFRHAQLLDALRQAGDAVTDEASAIEALGLKPRLVEADSRNFKVTYPRDLELVRLVLESQHV